MQENTNILTLSIDEELAKRFCKVAADNGLSPQTVLDSFMKDYTVSSGHAENVIGGMPWNRKSKTASYSYNPFCS